MSEKLLVVRWRNPDGSISSGCPLSPPQAESLARAFARLYPRQAYWLEPVPWLQSPAKRALEGRSAD